jgi:hypothetical protein
VDIRIGVTYTPKEVAVELSDDAKVDDVKALVSAALDGTSAVLWLEDRKGRQIAVPSDKISYVEIGSQDGDRPIGFG